MLLTDLQETHGSHYSFAGTCIYHSNSPARTQTFRLPLSVIECASGTCVKFLPSLHAGSWFWLILRKQTTFRDATNATREMTSEKGRRNFILMTCHYPGLSSASDWSRQISHAARPIRSNTQIWVVMRH